MCGERPTKVPADDRIRPRCNSSSSHSSMGLTSGRCSARGRFGMTQTKGAAVGLTDGPAPEVCDWVCVVPLRRPVLGSVKVRRARWASVAVADERLAGPTPRPIAEAAAWAARVPALVAPLAIAVLL